MVYTVIEGLVAILSLRLALVAPVRLVELLPLALGWFFPALFLLVWTPYKVTALAVTLVAVSWHGQRRLEWVRAPWAFVVIAVTSFVANYNAFADVNAAGYTTASDSKIRSVVQLSWALVAIVVSLCVSYVVRRSGTSLRVLGSFIAGALLLSLTGVYEFVAQRLGLPFRAIWYTPGHEGVAQFAAGSENISRITGLASEPKQLAKHVMFALVLLAAMRVTKARKVSLWVGVMFFGIVAATYSTASWLVAPLIILAACGVGWAIYGSAVMSRWLIGGTAVALVLSLGAFVTGVGRTATTIVDARTRGRGIDDLVEPQIVEMLLANPSDFILGFGPGNYSYVLPRDVHEDFHLAVMDSGWLTAVADYGALGALAVGLYLFGTLRVLVGVARTSVDPDLRREAALVSIALVAVVAQHVTNAMWETMWITAGVAQGLIARDRNASGA